jgi:hypothetical protein
MNKKTFLYIGIYAVAAYGAYYLYSNTKKAYASIILKAGMAGGGEAALLAFGKNYLKPWAMAAKAKQPTFLFEGNTYNTKGGKIVK